MRAAEGRLKGVTDENSSFINMLSGLILIHRDVNRHASAWTIRPRILLTSV